MKNMKIITAADSKYYKFLRPFEKNVYNLFHYYPIIYDLGLTSNQIQSLQSEVRRVQVNTEYACYDARGNIKATHKPLCILDCLRTYIDYNCLYVDTDILFTQSISKDIFVDSDLAVAHRHPKEQSDEHFMNGLINTGFIYFRNTPNIIDFLSEWHTECLKDNITDQIALSNLLSREISIPQFAKIHELNNKYININILDPNIYNDTSMSTGKVIHFKNAGRSNKIFKRYKIYFYLISMSSLLTTMYMMLRRYKIIIKENKKKHNY